MTKITRRTIPAVLASTAGLAAGFVAAAKAETSIDPVYAALDAWAEADLVYAKLSKRQAEAEAQYFAQRQKLVPPTHEGAELRTHEAVDALVNRSSMKVDIRACLHKVMTRHDEPDADRFRPTEEDLAAAREFDALRERLHAEVSAFEAADEAIRERTGERTADEAMRRAMTLRIERADAALSTIPTTMAGAAALARFAIRETEECGNDEPALLALASLVSFLSRTA